MLGGIASKPLFVLSFLAYYMTVKRLLESYYPEINSLIKTFILFVVPLLLKNGLTLLKRSFTKIGMTPDAKEIYNYTHPSQFENFKAKLASSFGNDVKNLEKHFYMTGTNVLIMSVQEVNIELIKYLLDNGYNVNLRDKKNGETALLRAIHFNKVEVVKLLLSYKADTEISSNEMRLTAIELAIFRKKPKIVDILLTEGCVFDYEVFNKCRLSKYIKWEEIEDSVKVVLAQHKCKFF